MTFCSLHISLQESKFTSISTSLLYTEIVLVSEDLAETTPSCGFLSIAFENPKKIYPSLFFRYHWVRRASTESINIGATSNLVVTTLDSPRKMYQLIGNHKDMGIIHTSFLRL